VYLFLVGLFSIGFVLGYLSERHTRIRNLLIAGAIGALQALAFYSMLVRVEPGPDLSEPATWLGLGLSGLSVASVGALIHTAVACLGIATATWTRHK
jgi:hypothetical protein